MAALFSCWSVLVEAAKMSGLVLSSNISKDHKSGHKSVFRSTEEAFVYSSLMGKTKYWNVSHNKLDSVSQSS